MSTYENSESIKKLGELIEQSKNIVFFGGAGVSTESGIPDFRSKDGLYNMKYKYPPEMIISRSFFIRNPEEFYRFYKDRMIYKDAMPNTAHYALSELEKKGKLKAVITQNIDGLHQKAGSKNAPRRISQGHWAFLKYFSYPFKCLDCCRAGHSRRCT